MLIILIVHVHFTIVVRPFTAEEHKKYTRRFEEGYNIPDVRYEQWINLYYPEEESKWELDSINLTYLDGKFKSATNDLVTLKMFYCRDEFIKTWWPSYSYLLWASYSRGPG